MIIQGAPLAIFSPSPRAHAPGEAFAPPLRPAAHPGGLRGRDLAPRRPHDTQRPALGHGRGAGAAQRGGTATAPGDDESQEGRLGDGITSLGF